MYGDESSKVKVLFLFPAESFILICKQQKKGGISSAPGMAINMFVS
jgi:hypothetical protein